MPPRPPGRALFFGASLLLISICSPASTSAQAALTADSAGTFTLQQAKRLTLERHPSLAAARQRSAAARALRSDAGRLPDPSLGLTVENFGGSLPSGLRETTLEFVQGFARGGMRGAQRAVADAELKRTERDGEIIARRLVTETSTRFVESWAQQERVDRLAAAEALARQAIAAAERRHREGAAPIVERTRAQAQAGLRRVERARAEASLRASRIELASACGVAPDSMGRLLLPAPSARGVPAAAALVLEAATHPWVRFARSEVDLEQAQRRLTRSERSPELELSGGLRQFAEGSQTGVIVGVRAGLPLWNRRAGAAAAADARIRAAEADVDEATRLSRTAMLATRERLIAASAALETLLSDVGPSAALALEQVLAAYLGGRLGYIELLDAQRGVLETDLTIVDAEREAWLARVELEQLLGRALDASGTEGGE